MGIFQDLQLSSWPRVVTEQDLAGFCCEGKLSYHSGVTWNQNSQISLQLFQTGCLCSNVLSEHETQSKFKLSRVPQACKANPMLWQYPEQIPSRQFTCYLSDLVTRHVQQDPLCSKIKPKQCKDHSSIPCKGQRIGWWQNPFEAGVGCSYTVDRGREIVVIQLLH